MKYFIILVIIFVGCSKTEIHESRNGEENNEKEVELNSLDDTVITQYEKNQHVILHLEREFTYGTTDNLIVGEIVAFTVDYRNRVFIADRNQTKIHVLNQDGSYLTSLGRSGQGPGEFNRIGIGTSMTVDSTKLYVTDGHFRFPHRAHVFSLENLSFSHTMNLLAENKRDFSEYLEGYNPVKLYSLSNGDHLVSYRRQENEYRDQISFIRYVIKNSNGNILSPPIFEQQDRINLVHLVENTSKPYNAIRTFPFFGKSLMVISNDEQIYTARTEIFEIKIYDLEGNEIESFSHPFTNIPLTKSELINKYQNLESSPMGQGVEVEMIKEADNLPDTWPALNSLIVDDENRIWVSTIVEDFDIYEWWVLEENGELITKFEWPRDEPIEVVKNGYLYTRETDEETGLQQIVRFRVEFGKV